MHYALFTLTDMSAEKSEQVGLTKIVGWHVSPQIGVICCSFIYETVHVGRLSANVFFVSANENLSGRSVGPNSSTDTRKTSADMNRLIERAATVIRRFIEQTCRPTQIFCRSDLSADKSASECIRQPIFLIALNLTIGSLNDSKFRNCC